MSLIRLFIQNVIANLTEEERDLLNKLAGRKSSFKTHGNKNQKNNFIDKSLPMYELQSFGQTLEMSNFLEDIKAAREKCRGNAKDYTVFYIKNGFKQAISL